MKKTLAVELFVLMTTVCLVAQPSAPGPAAPEQGQSPGLQQRQQINLDQVMERVTRVALSTSNDIGRLRIEKWKTDDDQKTQLQIVADSLQRNITYAVPSLIADVRESHGSVSSTFRLYHNLNVVYEFLISLADAAGNLGKREEYQPLAADAAALDAVRNSLSQYIEQAASSYESRVQAAPPPEEAVPAPVKIITDEAPVKPAKHTKKKTSGHATHHPSKPSPTPSKTPK
jgi:hypothetical protein